jgi:hypothetical protein
MKYRTQEERSAPAGGAGAARRGLRRRLGKWLAAKPTDSGSDYDADVD